MKCNAFKFHRSMLPTLHIPPSVEIKRPALIVRRCPISIHSHLEECDVRFVNVRRTFFCKTRNKSSIEVSSSCRCSATIVLTERNCLDEDYWQTKDNLLIRCRCWYLKKTFPLFSVAMINGSDYSSVDRMKNSERRRMNLWTVNWMDIGGRRMTRPSPSHLLSRTSSHLSSPCLFFSNEPRWKEGMKVWAFEDRNALNQRWK